MIFFLSKFNFSHLFPSAYQKADKRLQKFAFWVVLLRMMLCNKQKWEELTFKKLFLPKNIYIETAAQRGWWGGREKKIVPNLKTNINDNYYDYKQTRFPFSSLSCGAFFVIFFLPACFTSVCLRVWRGPELLMNPIA